MRFAHVRRRHLADERENIALKGAQCLAAFVGALDQLQPLPLVKQAANRHAGSLFGQGLQPQLLLVHSFLPVRFDFEESGLTLCRQAQLVGFTVGLHLLAHKLALFHRVDAVLNLHPQCVTVFADGGDVGFWPGADQHFAEFAAELVGEPELNRDGTVARHIDLALERSAVS